MTSSRSPHQSRWVRLGSPEPQRRTLWAVFVFLMACTEKTVPDDAIVSVIVAPATMVRNGPPSAVSVLLLDADGKPLGEGTALAITSTLGTLCVSDASGRACVEGEDSAGAVVVQRHDKGLVRALLYPGNITGSGTLTVKAGISSTTATISVAGALLPLGATLDLVAVPEAAPPTGGELQVFALARLQDGTAASDGSLITFTAARGSLASTAVLTEGGVAGTTVNETTESLPDTVIARSGVAVDTLVITAEASTILGLDSTLPAASRYRALAQMM